MYCKLSSFLVLGLKKSGYCATKLLLEKGAVVYVYDQSPNEISLKNLSELELLGAKKVNESDLNSILNTIDVLVLSPGVPIDNEIAILASKLNKRIIGELELGSYFITSPIIGVTGTNGKTTVCSMLSHILTLNNYENALVGNIGTPLTSKVDTITENTVCITEVSSFQLETTYRFLSHISCILNVTPDHLERHYNIENYAFLKGKLIYNLTKSEYAVLNYNDEIVKSLSEKTKGQIVWFSTTEKVNGAYLEDGNLVYNGEIICAANDLKLRGVHNIENYLAVIAILKLLGLETSQIKQGLITFCGVKHRIQKIKEVNGITFYNDSKSTNPDASIKAIESMDTKTVVILGGYDKGLDYTPLFNKIKENKKVESVVLTGMTANSMYKTATSVNVSNVYVVPNFNLAIRLSYLISNQGYAVLFSPATSSFDMFSDYEERGERFIEIVNSL